ncbi:unnamed protein product [Schistocephalus solidus]|uniref:Secreted protein n=1 Tax=Schistocephalus solidus TaxID=70667 RepID=A0A183SBV5_SCHSO|nr:unnamed protein product [Schistocephalus solidus]
MAISGLLAVISQPYPNQGTAAPELRTRDLVGQKSNALLTRTATSEPRTRDLVGQKSNALPTAPREPEPRTRDLVGQKSNALPTAPRARCLAGFDREY